MADQKVTDLSAITALTDDDLLLAIDAPGTTPATKKITWANVKATILAALDLGALIHAATADVELSDGDEFPIWDTTTSGFRKMTYATIRAALATLFAPLNPVLAKGYLFGLILSNNAGDATNDIDIATGKCQDSTDAASIILESALTKRLDAAWAVGTNQGGLDTGAIADTTYHVWLIKRSDMAVVDALFSASATAPTMPANYDYKRRIGSIIRVSGVIVGFIQNGDKFVRKIPIKSSTATNQDTAAHSIALNVPTGIRIQAIITASMYDTTSTAQVDWLITDLSLTDSTPTTSLLSMYTVPITSGSPAFSFLSQNIYTDTSAQIRSRVDTQLADLVLNLFTYGWIDDRGRLL
jgi:hypothetical protein